MGIIFSILSPAVFGVGNYIDKFLLEKHNIGYIVITIYGGIFAFIAGLVIIAFNGFHPIDTRSLLIILASGFLTSIYLLPYYKALSIDEASYVVPIYNFYPIFVITLSFILLGESLSFVQYLGSLIIVGAGFFLSVEKLNKKIFKLRPSFFYMIISSFLFSLAQVLYKFGVQEVSFLNTLPYEGFGIALGALSIALYRGNYKKFIGETKSFKKRVFFFMGINESLYVLARYTGYFAISLIPVGIVSVLAGFQPLFVLIYGIVLSFWFPKIIKEIINKKILAQKVISIVLMIVGLYFIFV